MVCTVVSRDWTRAVIGCIKMNFLICCDPLQRHKYIYTSRRHPRRNFRNVSKKLADESHEKLNEGTCICVNCLKRLRGRAGSPYDKDQPFAQKQDVTMNEDEEERDTSSGPESSSMAMAAADVSPKMTPTSASQSLDEILPSLDITPVRKRKKYSETYEILHIT